VKIGSFFFFNEPSKKKLICPCSKELIFGLFKKKIFFYFIRSKPQFFSFIGERAKNKVLLLEQSKKKWFSYVLLLGAPK